MGQPQPETEPHRQGDEQGIGSEQQQAALQGRLLQQLGGESAKSHKKSPRRNRDRGWVGWVVAGWSGGRTASEISEFGGYQLEACD